MRRRGRRAPEPSLFDLPLSETTAEAPPARRAAPPVAPVPAAAPARPPVPAPPSSQPIEPLPLFPDAANAAPRPLALVPVAPLPRAAAVPRPATLGARLLAGGADLVAQGVVALLLVAGTQLMGLPTRHADWPALATFLLVFSFFYTVVPLAFWGQTLGMAWRGLEARAAGGRPLAFGQTARRWLGGLATCAGGGLPLLLALAGRSLSDRLSGSWTWQRR